jgi:hypothetical protein
MIENEQQINKDVQEFAINKLLTEFHAAVDYVGKDPLEFNHLQEVLKQHNPNYVPYEANTNLPRAKVLAAVTAGVYAPFIHAYSSTVLKNIAEGNLPHVVIAPPRDAIPLALSLSELADIKGIDLTLLMPYINRNTAGINNNQKTGIAERSPYLDTHISQVKAKMNGAYGITEVETGIYGTTSLIMAKEFKDRGIRIYVPVKFYGLGPNLSYVHAVLSQGQCWQAEEAEAKGLVNQSLIDQTMVILDTMEELGMQNIYKSVEHLKENKGGIIRPVIVPVTSEEAEIARVTNEAVLRTAKLYSSMTVKDIFKLLDNIPWLIQQSKQGLPLTLQGPIPSMDSKGEHYLKIRSSGLFDYPALKL